MGTMQHLLKCFWIVSVFFFWILGKYLHCCLEWNTCQYSVHCWGVHVHIKGSVCYYVVTFVLFMTPWFTEVMFTTVSYSTAPFNNNEICPHNQDSYLCTLISLRCRTTSLEIPCHLHNIWQTTSSPQHLKNCLISTSCERPSHLQTRQLPNLDYHIRWKTMPSPRVITTMSPIFDCYTTTV